MPLHILPLTLPDFLTLTIQGFHAPGIDLTGQPTPLCWPITTHGEAQTRLDFHFAKQKERFLHDPTVRYMKVVDTTDKEGEAIMSIARWHFYPAGYDYETESHWEVYDLDTIPNVPGGFNIRLYNHILSTRDSVRPSWIPPNEPCWILMHLVTHPAYRGRGAAGKLVQWGIEQAEASKTRAYLEAGVMGRPVYERFGFEQVGELLEVDCRGFGVKMSMAMCKMVYVPKSFEEGSGEVGEAEE
ncbi:Acyl-CoA N-acyltransferases (Nat) [Glarea lozoyensis ATCC 20868]|uniref:Acyl-CoA N-acyltransferases (Nat) n=1 Tax=Glarea lozoyensis (strain ATCC 20868 / MF5171) TaxID=1116229 RepID=S3E4M6_GLAL2|nr:Acyl-CoA N-acyltransferases (Nat) [Glarea lozoyensis ATCC 20868]EPE33358.1 Acyl-CoA N-acyltransferases (Nat) [Glarea lozoyensis ATCC 20868]